MTPQNEYYSQIYQRLQQAILGIKDWLQTPSQPTKTKIKSIFIRVKQYFHLY